jgi:hypothetical protein
MFESRLCLPFYLPCLAVSWNSTLGSEINCLIMLLAYCSDGSIYLCVGTNLNMQADAGDVTACHLSIGYFLNCDPAPFTL